MESPPPSDDLDDCINFESKVLLALSRLQNGKKASKKNRVRKTSEVSCKKVVEFLKTNYSWLDGDIESQRLNDQSVANFSNKNLDGTKQIFIKYLHFTHYRFLSQACAALCRKNVTKYKVLTALLSNVKTGIVCALENGNYRLVGPNSKNMTSNCVALTSHGPKCSCVTMLKCTLKTAPHVCCHVKNTGVSVRKMAKRVKKKVGAKRKPVSSPRRKSNKNSPRKSAKEALNITGTSKNNVGEENGKAQCSYCLQIHPLPSDKSKKVCMKNYPLVIVPSIPKDKFSPREEVMSVVERLL